MSSSLDKLAGSVGPAGQASAAVGLQQLVRRAQQGDRKAREHLIATYRPFIMRAAASVSGRFVRAGEDDEASVAMMAFDEAITSYRQQGGRSFFSFAEMVIRRRLIDHFRREAGHRQEVPLSSLVPEGEEADGADDPLVQAEAREAHRQFEEALLAQERREEIQRLARQLRELGIRFEDLVERTPRHRDARKRALGVARLLAAQPELCEQLRRKGSLPLKELEAVAGVSRKTLERQRKYIIALALILSGNYPHLREYLAG